MSQPEFGHEPTLISGIKILQGSTVQIDREQMDAVGRDQIAKELRAVSHHPGIDT